MHTSGIELDTFEPFLDGLTDVGSSEELLELHLANVHRLRAQRDGFGGGAFDYTNEGYDGYIGHSGGRPGASAELRYYPELGVTISTIARRRGSARIMADRLADLVRCSKR